MIQDGRDALTGPGRGGWRLLLGLDGHLVPCARLLLLLLHRLLLILLLLLLLRWLLELLLLLRLLLELLLLGWLLELLLLLLRYLLELLVLSGGRQLLLSWHGSLAGGVRLRRKCNTHQATERRRPESRIIGCQCGDSPEGRLSAVSG